MSSRSPKHVAMFEIILPPFLVGWGRPSSWETRNGRLFGGLLLILIQQKPGERLYLKTLQSNSVSNDLQTRFRPENRKYQRNGGMHFSKTYTELLLSLPPELRSNAIEYRKLKKLINQVVQELTALGTLNYCLLFY